MSESQNLLAAENYFRALLKKDINAVSSLFDENVNFKGPLSSCAGKEEALRATSLFMTIFKTLRLLAKFSNEDAAALIYEVDRGAAAPVQRVAAYIKFNGNLIGAVEVFYDPRW